MSTFALSDADVEFARDLADRVHWTRENEDKFPPPEWRLVERLAVALVLNKRGYLATQYPQRSFPGAEVGYALDFVCSGRVSPFEDQLAWLHSMRDAVEDFTKEARSELD